MSELMFHKIVAVENFQMDTTKITLVFTDGGCDKQFIDMIISNKYLYKTNAQKQVAFHLAKKIVDIFPEEHMDHIANDIMLMIQAKKIDCSHSYYSHLMSPTVIGQSVQVSKIAYKNLPAMESVVKYPCECFSDTKDAKHSVYVIIQHLNDQDKWTRDKIADWIDKLHDDGIIDAEFKTPEDS